MPNYGRRYLMGPAKHFCSGPGRVLIDDSDKNVIEFLRSGGQAILVPRPWNMLRGMNAAQCVRSFLSLLAAQQGGEL